jgi:hypothetical protein
MRGSISIALGAPCCLTAREKNRLAGATSRRLRTVAPDEEWWCVGQGNAPFGHHPDRRRRFDHPRRYGGVPAFSSVCTRTLECGRCRGRSAPSLNSYDYRTPAAFDLIVATLPKVGSPVGLNVIHLIHTLLVCMYS